MKMMNIVFSLLVVLAFAGCAKNGAAVAASDDGTGAFSADGLGYNPSERWPEATPNGYNLSESTTGGDTCTAAHTFTNKAGYCMGLQNAELNGGCALAARKGEFYANCGMDFQPVNFTESFYLKGTDTVLNKECEAGVGDGVNATPVAYKYASEFCEMLKSEARNNGCFKAERENRFVSFGCKGPFSDTP